MIFRSFRVVRPIIPAAIAAFLIPVSVAAAAPQETIGSALVVVNLVTAEIEKDSRTLATGDAVHEDEIIDVAADARSELKLDDETKLALGPGSHLKLDKFVYDADKAKGSIVLDLVKGTFRFMTGVAQKPTYLIKTPAAAITVRGTIFDVYVEDSGLSWLLLHEGAIQVCNLRGECKTLDEPGKLIRITGDGDVGPPVKWTSLEGKDSVPFDSAFPFVSQTPGIDPNPIFTRDIIILGNLPVPDKPKGDKPGEETKPPKRSDKGRTNKAEPAPKKKVTKTKTAKKSKGDDDSNIMTGMDVVIGIGGGMGRMKGGGRGMGDGPRGGMSGGGKGR